MKIIIEIPEKTNDHIRSDYGHGVKGLEYEDMLMLCDAVYHGEPYHNRPRGECRTCKHFVRGGLDGKTYVCEHPDILLDDYFDYACITMNENDFCSRYEKEEGEAE